MSVTAVYVDGYDMAQLGMVVGTEIPGFRDGLAEREQWAAVPGRPDAVRISSQKNTEPRELQLEGVVEAADNATVRSRIREIKWRIAQKPIDIVFDDDTTLTLTAYLDGAPAFYPMGGALWTRRFRFSIPLRALDPTYAGTSTSVSVTASATPIPLGTAPSWPSISVSAATFTLTYRDSTGGTLYTLGVSGASGTPVVVDMQLRTVRVSGANSIDDMTTGSAFFALDPDDGDYPGSSWPSLACSAGTATVTYTKNYR